MKNWEQRFKTFSSLACLGTVGISLASLLGIYLDMPLLRQWFGEGPPMRFNTAVALICAGLSLFLRSLDSEPGLRRVADRIGLALGFIPLLIGSLTLFQYGLRIDLCVDQIFFQDALIPRGFPGRPSPETALNLVLMGWAILLANRQERPLKLVQRVLSLLILALPLITLTSSFFGADQFNSLFLSYPESVGAATNTVVASVLLAFSLFFRQPFDGLAELFTQNTAGGVIARRQLTAVIFVPLAIAFLSQFEMLFSQNNRPSSR